MYRCQVLPNYKRKNPAQYDNTYQPGIYEELFWTCSVYTCLIVLGRCFYILNSLWMKPFFM